ncbi:Ppx/GppA family phosphatase [Jeotgalibaca caeni]|uniref:Ppx/GppA family phosphatase n=1 Tax=Jeotgalibaca caeni TaxID=3028623 RepID=UPI00237EC2A9|nr:Ppx/GppA family phosphatase [Jeotgalibaca caeni]MDE1549043.1 Ppx/GppA family phosphatase [Jeotgalibaca caeni]
MSSERIGLIDIGSNTIRLVIFDIDENYNIRQLQNIKTPARLSQYLNEEKWMDQAGIDVLVEILQSFQQVAVYYQVAQLLPMATAAIRQSSNREEIIEQVAEKAGIDLMIVPEEKEAYYGSNAVTLTTQTKDSVTVDIGGGSTEVTYFENKEIKQYHSFPFGVVTLKQMFFQGKEHNDEKAIKKMTSFVKEQFKSIKWLSKLRVPITAIGGSARSIANVHQRQIDYPLAGVHGYQMSGSDLDLTLELFKSLSISELENLDGLSQDRTDIIIPANVVFNALFDEVKASLFIFSNKGLREGIILDYVNERANGTAFTKHNISTQSIYRLGLAYQTQNQVADQRGNLVSMLYDEFCKANLFEKDKYIARLLQYGSYLYYLGEYIESGAGSQHTFYIISNSELNAITHKERIIIALLASYKNRSLFNQYLEPFNDWFTVSFIDQLKAFGGMIKFANALDDSHMNVVKDIKLQKKNGAYELLIYHKGSVIAEKYRAMRQKKHLARVLKDDVVITFVDMESGEKETAEQ